MPPQTTDDTVHADDKKPNVLIYFLDELRADVLGCYGHPFVQTPTIDRIASQGMQFDNAYSNCPLCMPARNSFFTGQYPSEHGVTCNSIVEDRFAATSTSTPYAFGRILREAGYNRIIDVGKHHTGFSPETSGFTEAYSTPDKGGAGVTNLPEGADPDECQVVRIPGAPPNTIIGGSYPGPQVNTHVAHSVDKAMEVLDSLSDDESWAVRVSINTPHTPVLPPPPFDRMYEDNVRDWYFDDEELATRTPLLERWRESRGFEQLSREEQRWVRNSYLGLVSFVDSQIERLENYLHERGMNGNLITIFVADHGASIGDHGLQVKGPFDTDDIARIPLLVRYPDHINKGKNSSLVQLIDVLPTLTEFLQVPVPEEVSGRSMRPLLDGSASHLHDAVFSEGEWPHGGIDAGMRESIRTTEWLYTRYPDIQEQELFDLRSEAYQTHNIADENPNVIQELNERLDAWRRQYPRPS